MFRFVIKYLYFLTKIPGLPQIYEGLLLAWNMVFARSIIAYVDTIERTVTSWPGVTCNVHRFGGTQFNLGRREIGHVHGNGLVDILLTKSLKEVVIKDGKAYPHHIFPKSQWISRPVRCEKELELALELLRLSYDRLCRETLFPMGINC